jgi:protein-disulfide isomerase
VQKLKSSLKSPRGTLVIVLLIALAVFSCSEKVISKPNFVFKDAPDASAAIKVDGKMVSHKEIFSGLENDLYEAELKVYELKMNALKSYLLKHYMATDPQGKGLSEEAFIEKFIAKTVKITKKEIDDFIVEKKIPAEHLNDKMKERVEKFLEVEKKRDAVEKWLNAKTDKSPVEVYIAEPSRPVFEVSVGDAPVWGEANAKVTIIEFSDFQCPFCSKGATIIQELKKLYKGKIKIAFKQFPLAFHNHAAKAAEASLCANEQGVDYFWKLHDKMFEDQSKLDIPDLKNSAKSLGLNETSFNQCLDSGKYAAKVAADMVEGKNIGVKSTPTFFVNGKLVNGAQDVSVFVDLIEADLK